MIKDPDMNAFTIEKLEPFSKYLVSLQVVNPEGFGPAATVEVATDEGGELLGFDDDLDGTNTHLVSRKPKPRHDDNTVPSWLFALGAN